MQARKATSAASPGGAQGIELRFRRGRASKRVLRRTSAPEEPDQAVADRARASSVISRLLSSCPEMVGVGGSVRRAGAILARHVGAVNVRVGAL